MWQFDVSSHVTEDVGDTRLFKDIRFADLIETWCNDIYFANDYDCFFSFSLSLSLQISPAFKFNVIFELLPCTETLLTANSVHLPFSLYSFTNTFENICYWAATLYLLQIITKTSRNFSGKCEESLSKSIALFIAMLYHFIVLTLFQRVWAKSEDDKSFLLYANNEFACAIKSRNFHTMVCYTKQVVPNFH